MKAKMVLLVLSVISYSLLFGSPNFQTLEQPDGTKFQASEAGYCCYIKWYETPSGKIVVRGHDRYYYYAQPDEEKGFIASNQKVGIDDEKNAIRLKDFPMIMEKILSEVERYNTAVELNRQRFLKLQGKSDYGSNADNPSLGKVATTTLDIGILLVEFSDLGHHSPSYEKDEFEDMFFSEDEYYSGDPNYAETPDGEYVYGSMLDYFQTQSSGDFEITGGVINPEVSGDLRWLEIGSTSSYPGAYSGIAAPTDLVVDAINAAIDSGWTDVEDYSVTLIILAGSNDDLYETGVGYPKSYFSSTDFPVSFDWTNWYGAPVFHERCLGWAGIYSEGESFTHVGIWCHELGHVIGSGLLGGLMYHPDADASDWSMMRTGYRTGPLRKGDCPANLDPPAIISYGWNTPTTISSNLLNESVSYVSSEAQQKDFYIFNDPNSGSSRRFIIENRQYQDFNSYLPEYYQESGLGGLILWEWDSSTSNSRTIIPGDNDFDDIGSPYWHDGDGGDPFPGLSNNQIVTMATTPNTDLNSNKTGFAITSIPTSSTSMSVNFYTNYWSGTISANTTWSSANSPYYIGGDITIGAGVTLIIQSGVTVNFLDYDDQSSGKSSTKPEIIVNGTLQADGATFTAGTKGDWYGIVFNSGASSSSYLDDCIIENAYNAVYIDGSDPTVTECDIKDNSNQGLNIRNGADPVIDDNKIESDSYAAYIYSADGDFTHNSFDSDEDGVRILGTSSPIFHSNGNLFKSSITKNRAYVGGGSPNFGIFETADGNNTFSVPPVNYYYIINNTGTEVKAESNYWSTTTPDDNDFFGNVDRSPKWNHDMGAGPTWKLHPAKGIFNSAYEHYLQKDYAVAKEEFKSIFVNFYEWEDVAIALYRFAECASKNKSMQEELLFINDIVESTYPENIKNIARKWLVYHYAHMNDFETAEKIAFSAPEKSLFDRELLLDLAGYYANLNSDLESANWIVTVFLQRHNDDDGLEDSRLVLDLGENFKPNSAIDLDDDKLYKGFEVYPNPFNPSTTILLSLENEQFLDLAVYNMLGQQVKSLFNGRIQSGMHSFRWDGTNEAETSVTSGVYFIKMQADRQIKNIKVLFLK